MKVVAPFTIWKVEKFVFKFLKFNDQRRVSSFLRFYEEANEVKKIFEILIIRKLSRGTSTRASLEAWS